MRYLCEGRQLQRHRPLSQLKEAAQNFPTRVDPGKAMLLLLSPLLPNLGDGIGLEGKHVRSLLNRSVKLGQRPVPAAVHWAAS